MNGLRSLVATLALGTAAATFAPAAQAGHVAIGIGIGIGLPGVAVYAPGPIVVGPPYYYGAGYYGAWPGYGWGYYGRPYSHYGPGRGYFRGYAHGPVGHRWR
jgi:hypothetical protein